MKVCECGCGQATSIASRNSPERGWTKGEAIRFAPGHWDGQPRPLSTNEWWPEVITFLCDEKRKWLRDGGGDAEDAFDTAWRWALKAIPPRGRALAPIVPALFASGRDRQERSLLDCSRDYARDAWLNASPVLGRFQVGLLESLQDSSEPAARSRHLAA